MTSSGRAPTALPGWFRAALSRYPRVAIAGGPRAGKTTLSNLVTDRYVLHTDDLIREKWEDVPAVIQQRLRGQAAFVVEGVQVPRALRKGMVVDAVVWLPLPRVELTPGQASMFKAVTTVFEGWRSTSGGRMPVIVGN